MSKQNKSKTVQKRGALRRSSIIDAAGELFLAQSYERTTLNQIIERSGGSKSLLYEEFGGKEGLFEAVMADLCAKIFIPVANSKAASQSCSVTPRKVLTNLGHQFLKTIFSEDVLALTRVIFSEGTRHPGLADVFFTQGYEEGYILLAEYLMTVAPAVPLQKRLLLARMFFSMLKGDAFDRRLGGASLQRNSAEIEAQIEIAVDWLLICAVGA